MGEAVWPVERHGLHKHWPNMGGWLHSMAQVVVVLLRQRNDQLKIGLPWMKVYILSLVTN